MPPSTLDCLALFTLTSILASCSASTIEKLPLAECSICADGSSPTTLNNTIPISSTTTLSCSDLPTNAIASVYQQGLSNSDYQCAVSQLWAYHYCGCPSPPATVRDCWICKDGDTSYDSSIWVPTSSGVEGTCEFQARLGGLRYDYFGRASDAPELKCPYMTWGMDSWCGCPADTVTLPECRLCSGGASEKKCQRNPLATLLHTGQSSLGPNFGTCQYYDWLVERLNELQCGVYDMDSTFQFDGFDVQGFCCNNQATVVSGVTLCSTTQGNSLMTDKYVPVLDATCAEIAEAAPYLTNETVLVEPLEDLVGETAELSLRDYCCSGDATAQPSQPQRANICQPIPRKKYKRSGAAGWNTAIWETLMIFITTTILIQGYAV